MDTAPVLSLKGVRKAFAGVQALQEVDLELRAGEVHALLGENGAGKSTLMKILFGVVRPDAGEILLDGRERVAIAGPRHALALGIGLVSQELSLVPQLDVAQNIFLGQAGPLSLARRARLRARAAEILRPLAPSLPVTARVASLGMAERQVVEIARTLARGGRIIAFDEPTSSLTPAERDGLFALIRELRARGKALVYISHRMAEIHAVADRVTVLRDGRVVASGPLADFSQGSGELEELIAGRRLAQALHRPPPAIEAPAGGRPELLRLEGVTTGKLRGVDLVLRRGEIVGLAGLVGSGRTELVRAIFGADRLLAGRILVEGRPVAMRGPADAKAAGMALIPEDRRGHALVPLMSVEQNFGLANGDRYTRLGLLRLRRRRRETEGYVRRLAIKASATTARIRNLSGGNQQKVVIARWLRTGAKLFLFDEPTRGIDVGAKAEIHELLRGLAAEGCAVLVVSSELPELLTLCSRVAVMREGRLVRMLENGAGLTEDRLMRHAAGEEGLAA